MKSSQDKKHGNNKKKEEEFEEFEDVEDDEDDEIDIDDSGPKIASAKNNKVVVIAASSLLITVVLYLFFFKGDGKEEVVLQEIVTAPSPVATEDKSPFELDKVEFEKEAGEMNKDSSNIKEEIEVVQKPKSPAIPDLPSLPEDLVLPEQIFADDEIVEIKQNEKSQQQLGVNAQPVSGLPDLVVPPGQQALPASPGLGAQVGMANNSLNPRYSDIIVFSAPSEGGPSRGVGYENNIVNLNQDPIKALDVSPTSVVPTHIADLSHTIAQGKLLTAVIETSINTEVPGFVRGIVSRDVYAEAGNEVLIPRGTRLFGSYSSQINQGQGRVEIAWTRLIRPDGVDVAVNFNASDQFGRSGIAGDVDNKYGSIIASSLMTSILAIGGAAIAETVLNNGAVTTTTDPSNGTTTTTGNATNQVVSDVTSSIVDTVGEMITNRINTNPVIRIPQGAKITVIVNSDLVLPPVRKSF
ncbi:MAG: TrbI/VirB10 family protein [Rickettsiales bacterium]|nr:TrbI/VirB10 family protein [Rickettsiales bacterium]